MTQTGKRFLAFIIAAGLIAILVPAPTGLGVAEWQMLVLFAATVGAILWNPYPIGVVTLVSLGIGTVAGILSVSQALKGYSSAVTWIILAAFLFSRAFVKTGLGRRIALRFIEKLGTSSLKLGYSLTLTDLLLAPVTASNTARTGAIIYPVARSLAQEFDSHPGESAKRIGTYLLFTAYQVNIITSALFLTAMSANGLSVEFARSTLGVEITWGTWFYAASLPGAISLLLIPWVIYKLVPPQLTETPEAIDYAKRELAKLGSMSRDEKILSGVFVLLAGSFGTSGYHGVSTVAAALLGVAVLLITNVLEWDDAAGEKSAWGTYVWFGGLISLAGALTDTHLIQWFVDHTSSFLVGWDGMVALVALVILYLYIHYGFASMTSQIIALYAAFVAIAFAAGAPALLTGLVFCYFSNLYASLTHYGDGAAPIYYGSGYIPLKPWWTTGFVISLLHLLVWLGIGLPWWKLIGIW